MTQPLSRLLVLVVYVPVTHAGALRAALAAAGAGKIGAYDSCSFSTLGQGRFRPLPGSAPFLGSYETLETVAEERIELVVPEAAAPAVAKALRAAHPYEEIAAHFVPVLDWKSFLE